MFKSAALAQTILRLQTNDIKVIFIQILWFINWGLLNTFLGIYFFDISAGNYLQTGLLFGIPALTLVCTSFVFGTLSDLIGEKKVLLFAFLSLVAAYAVFSLVTTSEQFLITYIFFNLLLAAFTPALNRLSSRVVKQGTDIFGKLGAAGSGGYLVGTVTSGFLYDEFGMAVIFLLGFIIGSIGVLFILTLKIGNTEMSDDLNNVNITVNHKNNDLRTKLTLIKQKNVILMFILGFSLYVAVNISGPFFSIFLTYQLHVSGKIWGIMNGIATIIGVGISYGMGRYLHKRYKLPMLFSVVGYFLVYLIFGLTTNFILLLLVYAIPAYAGIMIAPPALVAEHIPENARGTAMGLLTASQNLGLGFGAILGGMVGYLTQNTQTNFILSAILCVFPFILTLLLDN